MFCYVQRVVDAAKKVRRGRRPQTGHVPPGILQVPDVETVVVLATDSTIGSVWRSTLVKFADYSGNSDSLASVNLGIVSTKAH